MLKPATPPLKSSLKDSKGDKIKFVKSQQLVGKVHRVQTKTPKQQLADDSEDDSNSSIDSKSSMSVEAAPRALIWRSDTSGSVSGRELFRLRNVSTIHSVRQAKLPTKEQDDSKAEAKSPTDPEAAATPAAQLETLPAEPPFEQSTSANKPRRLQ